MDESNQKLTPLVENEVKLKEFLDSLPGVPGVYRMYNQEDTILYVGKARNLKKRVSSYFQKKIQDRKTHSLVKHIDHIELTVTHTETEALILENNLIKLHKPRYNILLRDDKSFPFIYLSSEQTFPRFAFHRGAKKGQGRYFGPFPSAGAVRETLYLLQKLFNVRQCEDSFFQNRSRPCLQHQIKRCSGPCVDLISEQDYGEDVRHSIMVLDGRNNQVIDELVDKMDQAAQALEYEQAGKYRDQIASVRRIQEKQYVSSDLGDLDIIACEVKGGLACVQVFYIRGGRNLGNKTFFPRNAKEADREQTLAAFIPQFYLTQQGKGSEKDIPNGILLNQKISDQDLLAQILTQQSGRKVTLQVPARGEKVRWMEMALRNVQHALSNRLNNSLNTRKRYEALQEALGLEEMPERLECFDISHSSGEAPVASCVVFDGNGPLKSDYRRFNIRDITPGDDYAAMEQALSRRYKRLMNGQGKIPDLLFIDGGKGQVNKATQVLTDLQVPGVTIVGVAKGSDRKAGLETLILPESKREIYLPADSAALLLIQQIRDEAHRFAITGHRQRRQKARGQSVLEQINGLGAKRRALLIKQFGGIQEISRAGVEDLTRVSGISKQLAQRIYDTFHED